MFEYLTSDFLSSFCITMCLALLPEMLMCSWSLSISCPVPSCSISSFSSFLSCWPAAAATWADRTGGDARMGFTRPTWGSTGIGGRTGVTPSEGKADTKRMTNSKSTMQFNTSMSISCKLVEVCRTQRKCKTFVLKQKSSTLPWSHSKT